MKIFGKEISNIAIIISLVIIAALLFILFGGSDIVGEFKSNMERNVSQTSSKPILVTEPPIRYD